MVEIKKLWKVSLNIILAISAIVIYTGSKDANFIFLSLSTLSLIEFALFLYMNPLGITSPYSLFTIVLFIYNCGQIWLNLFGIPIIPGNYTITRYSDELLCESLLFFVFITIIANIFYIITVRTDNKTDQKGEPSYNKSGNRAYRWFFIILFICLLYDYLQWRTARSQGYAAALYSRSDSEILYMVNCILPFVSFFCLQSDLNNRKKIVVAIISALRYMLTAILIGYRMQAISYVLSLIVLLPYLVEKTKRRKYALVMVFALVAASYLSIVAANLRRGTVAADLWGSYNSFIQELGGTFTDLPIIIRDIDIIGPAYGLSYICGLLYIIPFIGRVFPGLSKYVNLSSILFTRITIYGDSSLGGSMLAEYFYNFKWLSVVIAAPILGVILGKITNSINGKNDAFNSSMLAYIFFILLLHARGNVGEITIYIRCAVYLYIAYKFLINRRRANNYIWQSMEKR